MSQLHCVPSNTTFIQLHNNLCNYAIINAVFLILKKAHDFKSHPLSIYSLIWSQKTLPKPYLKSTASIHLQYRQVPAPMQGTHTIRSQTLQSAAGLKMCVYCSVGGNWRTWRNTHRHREKMQTAHRKALGLTVIWTEDLVALRPHPPIQRVGQNRRFIRFIKSGEVATARYLNCMVAGCIFRLLLPLRGEEENFFCLYLICQSLDSGSRSETRLFSEPTEVWTEAFICPEAQRLGKLFLFIPERPRNPSLRIILSAGSLL